jgi:hypothetical protein
MKSKWNDLSSFASNVITQKGTSVPSVSTASPVSQTTVQPMMNTSNVGGKKMKKKTRAQKKVNKPKMNKKKSLKRSYKTRRAKK